MTQTERAYITIHNKFHPEGKQIRIRKPFPRPLEALSLAAQGYTIKETAEIMGIAADSAKNELADTRKCTHTTTTLSAVLTCLDARLSEESNTSWLSLQETINGRDLEGIHDLTGRECQIMSTMIDNYGRQSSNEQIAQKLEISSETVHNHLKSVYKKMDVETRVQAGVSCFAYAAITFGAIAYMQSQAKMLNR